ncbi:MAG: L,D-transpeptidase family protein [Candidatus Eiseniibacteriota bacterium]
MLQPLRLVSLAVTAAVLLGLAPAVSADELGDALKARLAAINSLPVASASAEERSVVAKFYQGRDYQPIWVDDNGVTDRARQVTTVLAASGNEGLEPRNYALPRIAELQSAKSAADRAELEALLSLAVVSYAADLSSGRLEPAKIDPENYLVPRDIDEAMVLGNLSTLPDPVEFLKHYVPDTPEYIRLRSALVAYRRIAKAGGWPTVPDGPTLKPGMKDARVPALRERLKVTGDLAADAPADDDPTFYDKTTEVALRDFQVRHGLDVDGAVGKQTLEELNVSVEQRIDQILANMERRRWMPDDPGPLYVFVNLADFQLKVVKEERTIYTSRVIVGAPYTRTPVFTGSMSYIEINPYWTVPPSIASKEILAAIKRDPGYLAKQRLKVFSGWSAGAEVVDPSTVSWASYTPRSFPYKIRQEPGEGNSLGRIAFMMPNKYNIYLHDTPAKSLFDRASRGFSHGCIRVQNPTKLAEVIFHDIEQDPKWTPEAIQAAIDTSQNQIVRLAKHIPVQIAYITAFANKDGTVHFRRDVYGRDARLMALLKTGRQTAQ